MKIVGVAAEQHQGERRVALVPGVISQLTAAALAVMVERGAGRAAGYSETDYERAGARSVDRAELFASCDILARVRGFDPEHQTGSRDLAMLRSGQVVLGLLNPFGPRDVIRELAQRGITSFALELLPRITRAQPMDALTSMATIAGYKAALLGAAASQKMYPMMITAAGTITPARVFVVGAGVTGLQAIATSRSLGAVVQAYDVRPAVKEQVQSLGARFLELGLDTKEAEAAGGYARAMDEEFYRRQQELMEKALTESDVVITSAAVPGRRAPVLITARAVHQMRPGACIIDLAADSGGNCELTRPGETVEAAGVSIMGPLNLPSTVPYHASHMYARNITAFLLNLVKSGELSLNLADPIIHDTLLTHKGEVVHPDVRKARDLLAPAAAVEEGTP